MEVHFRSVEHVGVLVAVALVDKHHCEPKMQEAKRFKGATGKRSLPKNNQRVIDQPISPYRLFMESFTKKHKKGNLIEIDRRGFEKWQNMSKEEKEPFVSQARELDEKHQEALDREVDQMIKVNDEADSKEPVKVEKSQWIYIEDSE